MASQYSPIWVLCDAYDTAAQWAAARLHERGRSVSVVTAAQLDTAVRWRHRVTRAGKASVTIELADGRCLSSEDRSAVLNRLSYIATDRIAAVAGADRDYATQEMHALFLSWLHGLPGPMLNRPTTQGLGGNWRHPSAWAVLAGRAGLRSKPYRQTSETDPDAAWSPPHQAGLVTVFAVAGRLVAPPLLPSDTRAGCLRLGALSGEALLGIDLHDGNWEFQGASPRPDLFQGGVPLIDALAQVLS
jgi:hypothetical protein